MPVTCCSGYSEVRTLHIYFRTQQEEAAETPQVSTASS